MMRALALLAAAAVTALSVGNAHGADFPTRPIRLVVGFAAGGPTDVAARIVAKGLSDEFGQQVIVDNRPGANANIAADVVVGAAPDGYTLLYATSSIVISQFMYKDLRYGLKRDLVPVGLAVTIPNVLVVPSASPYRTIEEFVAALKGGARLTFGSAGLGNANHISPLMFLKGIGASAQHVPYRGSAPALNDLVAGRVDFMADAISTELPFIESGMLRPLGVAAREPLAKLPGVPALAVSIVPGFEIGAWSGILAPAKTPPEIVAKLEVGLRRTLMQADIRARFEAQSTTVVNEGAEGFGRFIDRESAALGAVIRDAGIRPE